MNKGWLALAVVACLAGCSSGVKLDQPPVEDKTGVEVTAGAGSSSGAASGVTSVNLGKGGLDGVGPGGPSIVYFDFDSYVVKPEYQSVVENHAKYLRADAKRKAMLEGHTDERGGREYNLALGQRRSEAVAKALVLLGVSGGQVEAVSFGKEKPAVEGSGEEAWAKNRRVEVKYR